MISWRWEWWRREGTKSGGNIMERGERTNRIDCDERVWGGWRSYIEGLASIEIPSFYKVFAVWVTLLTCETDCTVRKNVKGALSVMLLVREGDYGCTGYRPLCCTYVCKIIYPYTWSTRSFFLFCDIMQGFGRLLLAMLGLWHHRWKVAAHICLHRTHHEKKRIDDHHSKTKKWFEISNVPASVYLLCHHLSIAPPAQQCDICFQHLVL